jgi:hypothetical protein
MAPPVGESDEDAAGNAKERRSYLVEMYKLYQAHINTMFNYFLILSGLIANACIISLQQAGTSKMIPAAIGAFGFITSIVSFFVHLRSRELLDIIEDGLKREEGCLFAPETGFLNVSRHKRWKISRHRFQFRVIYILFAIGFLLFSAYAICIYRSQT